MEEDLDWYNGTHRSHGRILIGPKGNFANDAVLGMLWLVLGKRHRNRSSRGVVQPKGSLVQDHAVFVENHVRRPILVHPPVRSTVHLQGHGKLVDLPYGVVLAALVMDANGVAAATGTTNSTSSGSRSTTTPRGLDVGHHVVEIAPIVVIVVSIGIPIPATSHERRRQSGFPHKGVSVQNIESSFLVQAFHIDVRHDVVALGFRNGQPGLDRPRHAGIVEAGAPFSKGTVQVSSGTKKEVCVFDL